jgi:hypothetical protein
MIKSMTGDFVSLPQKSTEIRMWDDHLSLLQQ